MTDQCSDLDGQRAKGLEMSFEGLLRYGADLQLWWARSFDAARRHEQFDEPRPQPEDYE